MDHSNFIEKYLRGEGVEIGAYTRPIQGIAPIYVDRYKHYAGSETNAQYYGDATDLPFYDSSLNYVASSHVLEHAANPLAALKEWYRVLKHGGFVYMVIPDHRFTFDRPRKLTTVSHMLADYKQGKDMSDDTHISEFTYGVDWRLFSPDSEPENEEKERAAYAKARFDNLKTQGEVNIHFHTFESDTAVKLIEIGNRERIWEGEFKVLEVHERFPQWDDIGFLVVAKVSKPPINRLFSIFSQKGLLGTAVKFDRS